MATYTSEQYKIFTELSSLIKNAVLECGIENYVSAALNQKFDKSAQLLVTPGSNKAGCLRTYTAAGITLANIGDAKPVLSLSCTTYDPALTTDKLLEELTTNYNIIQPEKYAEHYSSGVINQIDLSFNDYDLVSLDKLESILDDHNVEASSHQNLNKLINYYNKQEISKQLSKITLQYTKADNNILNKISIDKSQLKDDLTNHNVDKAAHQNLNQLLNYYDKTKIDEITNNLKSYTDTSIYNHNKNTNAHQDIRDLIKQLTSKSNIEDDFRLDHINNELGLHQKLVKKDNAETNYSLTVNQSNTNSSYLKLQSKNSDAYIENDSSKLLVKKASTSITLLDNNGNSIFNSISMSTGRVNSTPALTDSSTLIPNTSWVKNYVDLVTSYNPYDSMPDYAHTLNIGTGVSSYIVKINVPGYLYFYTGHCSDCDMTIYASYNSTYLSDVNSKTSKSSYIKQVIKLNECFGYGDRNQSSIHFPIYPGSTTYLLLNSSGSGNIKNTYWCFIPSLGVRSVTVDHTKYISIIKTVKSGHIPINTIPTTAVYSATFNTLNNPNIWKQNI